MDSTPAARPSLDDLGKQNGTDKASGSHNYLVHYDRALQHLRDRPVMLLEVGVFRGASLRTWRDYFPQGNVVGVDINPKARSYEDTRITIRIADQGNAEDLADLADEFAPFDVVVDDGSHIWVHQILTLQTLLAHVKPGHFFIVEDLNTSYGRYVEDYGKPGTISASAFVLGLADRVLGGAEPAAGSDAADKRLARLAPLVASATFAKHTSILQRTGATGTEAPLARLIGGTPGGVTTALALGTVDLAAWQAMLPGIALRHEAAAGATPQLLAALAAKDGPWDLIIDGTDPQGATLAERVPLLAAQVEAGGTYVLEGAATGGAAAQLAISVSHHVVGQGLIEAPPGTPALLANAGQVFDTVSMLPGRILFGRSGQAPAKVARLLGEG
jgi:hypothetical protein